MRYNKHMEQHNIFEGRLVRLRGIEASDWEHFHLWNEDSDSARQSWAIPVPVSSEFVKRWAQEQALSASKGDEYRFAIETVATADHAAELVGTLNTHSCDARSGTFKYGIAIRRQAWRRGYASEAIRLILHYYFNELRYQKCTVHVYEFNQGSLLLHEALGFQHEGRLRRMIYSEGRYWDEFVLGITSEEFAQSLLTHE